MTPWTIYQGDVLDVLSTLPSGYFHATLSDPPYGLNFMGRQWDHGVPSSSVYAEILRALKPGAPLLHFGGTRTYHRLTCSIEDAGFEIRDCLMWVYGSGFPKSHNISKAIDRCNGEPDRLLKFTRWMRSTGVSAGQVSQELRRCGLISENGTMAGHFFAKSQAGQPAIPTAALWEKIRPLCGFIPAWVDDLVARIEAEREVVGSVEGGRLAVAPGQGEDRSSKTLDITAPATPQAAQWEGYGTALKPAYEPVVMAMKPCDGTFANNALVYGVAGLNVEGAQIGEQGRFPANLLHDGSPEATHGMGDKARYFYCAKASKSEREAGLSEREAGLSEREAGVGAFRDAGRGAKKVNNHPCVKPIDLIRYLATLILPPPGDTPRRILVPYSGSGSEMIGCLLAGWDEVHGIEIDPSYIDIAHARLEHWVSRGAA